MGARCEAARRAVEVTFRMEASPRRLTGPCTGLARTPRLLRDAGPVNGLRCSTNRIEARIDFVSRSLPACGRVVGRQVLALCATGYFKRLLAIFLPVEIAASLVNQ